MCWVSVSIRFTRAVDGPSVLCGIPTSSHIPLPRIAPLHIPVPLWPSARAVGRGLLPPIPFLAQAYPSSLWITSTEVGAPPHWVWEVGSTMADSRHGLPLARSEGVVGNRLQGIRVTTLYPCTYGNNRDVLAVRTYVTRWTMNYELIM